MTFSKTDGRRFVAILASLALILALGVQFAPDAAANHPPGSCLDTEPETATNTLPTTQNHTMTATLRNGVPGTCTGTAVPAVQMVTINFEILSGPNDTNDVDTDTGSPDLQCTMQPATSSCQAGYTSNGTSGTDLIRSWISDTTPDTGEGLSDADGDTTDVVEKRWQKAAARLDCDDESGNDHETNPDQSGSASTENYTCTVTDSTGGAVSGVRVWGENRGPCCNDPDDSASFSTADYQCGPTGTDGKCTIAVSQTNNSGLTGPPQVGTAVICFWAEEDGNAVPDSGGTLCAAETETDETENNDLADQVEKTWEVRSTINGGLDAEAEFAQNDTNKTQTILVTLYDQFGQPFQGGGVQVKFEFFQLSPSDGDGNTPESPDATCTTVGATCTHSYSSANAGTDRICVWINDAPAMTGDNLTGTCAGEGLSDADDAAGTADAPEPVNDDVDVVDRHWIAAAATDARRLDCTPETETAPTGTTSNIVCTAANNQGQTVATANLDIELIGANDPDGTDSPQTPDYTCNTGAGGVCTFRHGPAGEGLTTTAGTTIYKIWIDEDGQNTSTELDTAEARDENTSQGTKIEPDGTDVVEKTWTSEVSTITISPNSDTATVGECNPYTITAKNSAQQPTINAFLDVEQVHENATNATLNDEPTVSFCTPTTGANPSAVTETAGDLRPPQETPDNPGTSGGETAKGTDTNGQVTIGIRVTPSVGSTGAGTVTLTVFTDPNDNDDRDAGEATVTATKSWITAAAGGRTIDCLPDTASTPVTEDHTVTCTVEDAAGAVLSGVSVSFSETGQGDIASEPQKETDSNGQATVTVSSDAPGAETITGTITNSEQNEPDTDECDKAAGDPANSPAGDCEDSVTNTWTDAAQPECSDGDDNDDDGQTDFPDDDGCTSADDDSEAEKCPGLESVPGNHVVGTSGDDTLNGTSGDDVICGLGGDDEINGLDGDDLLIGGDGNDTVSGGDGADDLEGDADDDTLKGDDDNDDVLGGAGDDTITGGAGNDSLLGEGGNDSAKGGGGIDFVSGAAGKDKVFGGGGNDSVKGGGANDSLRGDAGNDQLKGGGGRDKCDGGSGRDHCKGGPGKDKIQRCEAGDKKRGKQLVR